MVVVVIWGGRLGKRGVEERMDWNKISLWLIMVGLLNSILAWFKLYKSTMRPNKIIKLT